MTQLYPPPGGSAFTLVLAFFGLSQPALAFDCKKAASPVEKAICGNPAALSADEEMSSAFTSLYSSLDEVDKKRLLASQREWLKLRPGLCTGDKGLSVNCLTEQTRNRALFLQGKPESGPGTGHELIPIVIAQKGSAHRYEQDISLAKFKAPVLPGEKLFNENVEKLLKDAPSVKGSDDQPDQTYTYTLNLHLTFASPRFLSASVETYVFEGGAHGNGGTSGINIDVVKGKPVNFADVFEPAANLKLEDLCFTQIKARKTGDGSELDADDVTKIRGTIREDLAKFDSWSFSETQGVLTFDAYEIGSYAEGAYTCTFPVDVLRPLYKAGGILP